jgi:hypothetical protein
LQSGDAEDLEDSRTAVAGEIFLGLGVGLVIQGRMVSRRRDCGTIDSVEEFGEVD